MSALELGCIRKPQRSGSSGSAKVRRPGHTVFPDHTVLPAPHTPFHSPLRKKATEASEPQGCTHWTGYYRGKGHRNRNTAVRLRNQSICPKYKFSQHLFTLNNVLFTYSISFDTLEDDIKKNEIMPFASRDYLTKWSKWSKSDKDRYH